MVESGILNINIVEMATRKSHRHKSHKRVTHKHKSHKRVTHRQRRSKGGYPRTVAEIRNAYEAIKQKTKTMTLNNYEEVHSEIRALHNEAKNAGNSKLAQQIQGYEYGVVNQEIKKLHANESQNAIETSLKTPIKTEIESTVDLQTENLE
jgi:hypothetical protein